MVTDVTFPACIAMMRDFIAANPGCGIRTSVPWRSGRVREPEPQGTLGICANTLVMLIRDSAVCPHHEVVDRSLLCELLHPDKEDGAGNLGCSVAHAIVLPGQSTLPHTLNKSTELYYILAGTGQIQVGDETATVRPGEIVLIPPGAVQHIRNPGTRDLVFLCIVSPAWQADDEALVPQKQP